MFNSACTSIHKISAYDEGMRISGNKSLESLITPISTLFQSICAEDEKAVMLTYCIVAYWQDCMLDCHFFLYEVEKHISMGFSPADA